VRYYRCGTFAAQKASTGLENEFARIKFSYPLPSVKLSAP